MAISEIWSISGPASGTLADLDVESASMRFVAAGVDTLSLRFAEDGHAGSSWATDTELILRRNSSVFFRGRVAPEDRSRSDVRDSKTVTIEGPWERAQRLVYSQPWTHWNGSGVATQPEHPRVTLGESADGKTTELRSAWSEILGFCANKGVGIAAGTLPPSRKVNLIETHSRTCADLLREILRWYPDCLIWLDYSTNPARLHLVKESSAGSEVIAATGRPLTNFRLRRLDHRVPTNVIVSYETTVDDPQALLEDGDPDNRLRLQIHQDTAGGSANQVGTLFAVMPVTLPETADPKSHAQEILTRVLPRDNAVDEVARKWWLDHSKLLRLGLTIDDFVLPSADTADVKKHRLQIIDELTDPITGQPRKDMFTPSAVGLTVPEGELYPEYWTDNLDRLPRELVEGSIHGWMRRKLGKVRATASVGIKQESWADLSDEAKAELLKDGAFSASFESGLYYVLDLESTVRATDAISKVYKQVVPVDGGTSPQIADQIVPDLAQKVYDAAKTPEWGGSILLTEEEAGGRRYLGKKINVSGGRSEWGSMNARPQEESITLETGETAITVGPPEHLSVQDWAERLRALRAPAAKPVSLGGAARDPQARRRSRTERDKNPVIGSTFSPIREDRVVTKPPKQPQWWGLKVVDDNDTKKIQLDPVGIIHYGGYNNIANTITAIDALFDLPAAGEKMWIEWDFAADPTTITLKVDEDWEEYPQQNVYEEIESLDYGEDGPNLIMYRELLWAFTDTDPGAGVAEKVALAEDLWAVRIIQPSYAFSFNSTSDFDSSNGYRLAGLRLLPDHALVV